MYGVRAGDGAPEDQLRSAGRWDFERAVANRETAMESRHSMKMCDRRRLRDGALESGKVPELGRADGTHIGGERTQRPNKEQAYI